jgi:hypothetical protein
MIESVLVEAGDVLRPRAGVVVRRCGVGAVGDGADIGVELPQASGTLSCAELGPRFTGGAAATWVLAGAGAAALVVAWAGVAGAVGLMVAGASGVSVTAGVGDAVVARADGVADRDVAGAAAVSSGEPWVIK